MNSTKKKLQVLVELRRRVHNISTGAEKTKNDNEALNLIVRLCELSYRPISKYAHD